MGYVLSFLLTVAMVILALIVVMSVPFLRKTAGLGNVAPSGPAAAFAPAVAA